MVFGALSGFASWSRLKGACNDDWVDRMSHIYTVFLLAVFAVIISTGQYVGDPIHCWCPAQFTGAFVSYTKYICWISNTYYVPMADTIPIDIDDRENREITYYQWVPLILLFMAFLFKLPNIAWSLLNGGSGINLDKLVTMAENTQIGSPEERTKTIKHISYFMDRWLETNREYTFNVVVRMRQRFAKVCCLFCGKREGTYLTGFYMFCKLLYCVNAIGQFFLLNAFMSTSYNMYGFEVMKHLSTQGEWKESARFPRVTLCDFQIRQLQNIQRFTVQCVLPINLFNEKIFIFIWFWLVFVAALGVGSFITWVYRVVFKRSHVAYVKKYLKIADEVSTGFDKKMCRKFAEEYLRDDGMFVLRVVGKNSTDMVLKDLIIELWKVYKDKPIFRKNIPETYDETKESLA